MKLIRLTSLGISIGLLNFQILFAQSNTIPLNQPSVLVDEYSNINSYTENSNFSPQMEMDPGIVEGVEEALGLETFRQALENHPTAERLVIHKEEGTVSISPRGGARNIYGPNGIHQNENREIIDHLKALLPPELANDPLLQHQLSSNSNGARIGTDPLSAVRLREIIKKIDEGAIAKLKSEIDSSSVAITSTSSHQLSIPSSIFTTSAIAGEKFFEAGKLSAQEAATEVLSGGNKRAQRVARLLKDVDTKRAAQDAITIQAEKHHAEQYGNVLKAHLLGNEEEFTRLTQADNAAALQINQLMMVTTWPEKASKAAEQGNKIISDLWKKAAEQYQIIAEYEKKAVEVEQNGKLELTKAWREAIQQRQQALEHFAKGSAAEAAGKTSEANDWNNIGFALLSAAEQAVEEATIGLAVVIGGGGERAEAPEQVRGRETKESIIRLENDKKEIETKMQQARFKTMQVRGWYWGTIGTKLLALLFALHRIAVFSFPDYGREVQSSILCNSHFTFAPRNKFGDFLGCQSLNDITAEVTKLEQIIWKKLWDDADINDQNVYQEVRDIEKDCDLLASTCKTGWTYFPEKLKNNTSWIESCNSSEKRKFFWNQRAIAEQALMVARDNWNTALKAPNDEHVWNNFIKSSDALDTAWNNIKFGDLSKEKAKRFNWDTHREIARQQKNVLDSLGNIKGVLERTNAAWRIGLASSHNKIIWKNFIALTEQVSTGLKQFIDKHCIQKAPEPLKINWEENCKKAKEQQIVWNSVKKLQEDSKLVDEAWQLSFIIYSDVKSSWNNAVTLTKKVTQRWKESSIKEKIIKPFDNIKTWWDNYYEVATIMLNTPGRAQAEAASVKAETAWETAFAESGKKVVWKKLSQIANDTTAIWNDRMKPYEKYLSYLPEECQSNWKENLNQAKKQYYIWDSVTKIASSWNEALKAPNNENVWNNFIKISDDSNQAWSNIINWNVQREIAQQQKNILDNLNKAEKNLNHVNVAWKASLVRPKDKIIWRDFVTLVEQAFEAWNKTAHGSCAKAPEFLEKEWADSCKKAKRQKNRWNKVQELAVDSMELDKAWEMAFLSSDNKHVWQKAVGLTASITQRWRDKVLQEAVLEDSHNMTTRWDGYDEVAEAMLKTPLEKQAEAISDEAEVAWENAVDKDEDEIVWQKFLQAAKSASTIWNTRMNAYEKYLAYIPNELQTNWEENLNQAKKQYDIWNDVTENLEDFKKNGLAWGKERHDFWKGELLFYQAEKATSLAVTACNNAQQETDWNKALDLHKNHIQAWQNTVELYEAALNNKNLEGFKSLWNKNLESGRDAKSRIGEGYFLWCQAQKANSLVQDAHIRAMSPHISEHEAAWNEAINLQKEGIKAWNKVVAFYETGWSQALERFKPSWVSDAEFFKDNKARVGEGYLLWYQAEKFYYFALDARDKAKKLLPAQREADWNKAIDFQNQFIRASKEALNFYEAGWSQALERFKPSWVSDAEFFKDKSRIGESDLLWYQAEKARTSALVALDRVKNLPTVIQEIAWDEAISLQKQSIHAWKEVLDFNEKEWKESPENLKSTWAWKLEDIKNYKVSLGDAALLCYQAWRMDTIALIAGERAIALPITKQDVAWKEAIELQDKRIQAWKETVDFFERAWTEAPERFKANLASDLQLAKSIYKDAQKLYLFWDQPQERGQAIILTK